MWSNIPNVQAQIYTSLDVRPIVTDFKYYFWKFSSALALKPSGEFQDP